MADEVVSTCTSRYKVTDQLFLECTHHYENSVARRHQAIFMDSRWFWSDREAESS